MGKAWAVAVNTFIEGLRARTLYVLFAYGLLMLAAATVMVPLAMGEEGRILKDLGLAGIEFMGMMLAIVVGTTLIYKEVERRTVYIIISKPIERYQFLLGKFLGMELLMLVLVAAMTALFMGGQLLLEHRFPPVLLFPAGLIFLKITIINSLALFFSGITSPILGAVFTLCLYLAGTLSRDILAWSRQMAAPAARITLKAFYYLLPNMRDLDFKNQVVFNQPVQWTQAYSLAVIFLAVVIFERKDLK